MLSARSVSLIFIGALVAGCAGEPGQTEEQAPAEAQAPEQAPAQALAGCYLGDGTMEEAQARPSPLATTAVTLGGEEATLCYGRPSARGRTIMGELVPYGTPWRLGANEATAIHLPFAAEIGTVRVDPGVYSLYAVPGETEWTIFVNRSAERWGIPINDEVKTADLGSFTTPVAATTEPVETLTFAWEPQGEDAGVLVMTWENARVEIPIRRVTA